MVEPGPHHPRSSDLSSCPDQTGVVRRKAILHIGTMKTGTSSIQAMLAQNRPWLAERGFVFVPGIQSTAKEVARRVDLLGPDQNLIISDEGLWHFARSPRSDTDQIAEALKGFDVTVLTYLRRPDGFQESWFIQGLKRGTGTPSLRAFIKAPFVRTGSNILGRLQIFVDLFGPEAIRLAPYERAQMAHGDAMIDFLVRIGLAQPADTHDSVMARGLVWPAETNVTPDVDTMLMVSLLRHYGQCTQAELNELMQRAPQRKGRKTQILRAKECESINARYRPMFAKVQKLYGGGAEPDFFLDWTVSQTKEVCALRPIYDRMIEQYRAQTPVGDDTQNTTTHPSLRVAFVIQKLAGLSGGAERVFTETAEAMAARGIAARLICLDADLSVPLAFGSGSIPLTSVLPAWLRRRTKRGNQRAGAAPGRSRAETLLKALPNVFPLTRLKWQLSHGMFQRALTQDLERTPADVIVAFLPPAITAAAATGIKLGVPVVASIHNLPALDFGASDRWDQNPVYRSHARKALAQVARLTVLQPEFKSWFGSEVVPRVTVMPNPVSRLSDLPDPAPAREKIILGVGRLTQIKRWDLLIEAFALAAPTMPDWSLRLFGIGPEHRALQARIVQLGMASRIAILPPTPDIGAVYDRASLLVHPSEFEGFGLSVAEAMAHGVPVVAFADCPGVNALIEDGHSGLLLTRPADDVAAAQGIAHALTQLSQDPERRAQLSAEATAITRRFNRESIHDEWAKLLRDVVKKFAES